MGPEVFYSYLKKHFPNVLLSDEQLKELLAISRFKVLQKNEKIFFDSEASQLYVVLKGKMKLVDFSSADYCIVKDILHEADFFGDISLSNRKMPEEYSEALSNNTIVCFSPVITVRKFITNHPFLAIHLVVHNAMLVKRLEKRYHHLAHTDIRTRFIYFLNNWAKKDGECANGKIILENCFTLNEVAGYLSTTRQTIYTLLKEFNSKGYLKWEKKKIELYSDLEMDKIF